MNAKEQFEELKKDYLEAKKEGWGPEFIGSHGDFFGGRGGEIK